MAMAMVRRRIAGYAKVKRKRPALPRRHDPNDQLVGEGARVYAPMAAVGRAVAPPPWWQKYAKPLGFGFLAIVGGLVALLIMKGPSRPAYDSSAERPEYPRSASLSHSRVVGAVAARSGGPAMAGARSGDHLGGSNEVVLSNRATPSEDSFRATGYARKKVFLPDISGNCTVTGSGGKDIGECLRQQAGE